MSCKEENMRIKRTICLALASISVLGTIGLNAAAYWDNDREVNYYSYDLWLDTETDVLAERVENAMERLYSDRNWVISVNAVSETVYPINYGLMCGVSGDAYAYDCCLKGTGNTGAGYRSDASVGKVLWLNAGLDIKELERQGKTSSGQWSTDAPY